jgi:hypothetical protein
MKLKIEKKKEKEQCIVDVGQKIVEEFCSNPNKQQKKNHPPSPSTFLSPFAHSKEVQKKQNRKKKPKRPKKKPSWGTLCTQPKTTNQKQNKMKPKTCR